MTTAQAFFYPWETVTYKITFDKADALVDYKQLMVAIRQGRKALYKSTDDLEIAGDVVTLKLSQSETGQFVKGTAYIQVNILYEDKERDVTAIETLDVRHNLYQGPMT